MVWAALSAQGTWALASYGVVATLILLWTILRSLQHPSQKAALEAEVVRLQDHCNQLQHQLQAIAAENQQLRADSDYWQQQHQALNAQLTTLETTYHQLEMNLQRLEQERDRLQQALQQPADWWQEMTKNYQSWWESLPFLPHEDTSSKS
ncbi:hypothetical protein RHP47_01155 [Thermosynechococcus sp. QKsg1]|uniref:hypothetical protein n=1 Tax=unclassified Thermosynechococcus TaxID=2622553 RepID=UPI00122E5FF2|nr:MULTISPECIES: hypothetical protein [unclassified Thermosynechococcus]QEQ00109.1 hypothetical protein FFX45_01120 [Thermosynechococcus sp. CL-1]WJI24310.1 hypothetical protein MZ909_01155 [Thermosynechococcus sp. B0]WJI26829.1 hypothetical protein M0644_01170 [Thermosynechococcus sp. B1]WJI29361.1 hypothetical protein M0646_01190 [Thermosynechococcus sp. B3]WKT83942.1 hypothetical protein QYC28_01115 [Thermosynechococcus sp. HY596]